MCKPNSRALPRQRGSNAETPVREAIEHFVEYDEWFIREVEKGPASVERANF